MLNFAVLKIMNKSFNGQSNMSLNIIVLAKQVPDTRNVGKDAMKADGTLSLIHI